MNKPKDWSKQSVFDFVAEHLLKQNAKSISAGNWLKCAYRGVDGALCAVGCLIDDDAYSPDLETLSVDEPAVINALLRSGAPREALTLAKRYSLQWLLGDLQSMHDKHDPNTWPNHLRKIAATYGLSAEVIDRVLAERKPAAH